jgi:hypothetical protein
MDQPRAAPKILLIHDLGVCRRIAVFTRQLLNGVRESVSPEEPVSRRPRLRKDAERGYELAGFGTALRVGRCSYKVRKRAEFRRLRRAIAVAGDPRKVRILHLGAEIPAAYRRPQGLGYPVYSFDLDCLAKTDDRNGPI